jgi:hypothetical protein
VVLGPENESPEMSDAKLAPQPEDAPSGRIQGREWQAENGPAEGKYQMGVLHRFPATKVGKMPHRCQTAGLIAWNSHDKQCKIAALIGRANVAFPRVKIAADIKMPMRESCMRKSLDLTITRGQTMPAESSSNESEEKKEQERSGSLHAHGSPSIDLFCPFLAVSRPLTTCSWTKLSFVPGRAHGTWGELPGMRRNLHREATGGRREDTARKIIHALVMNRNEQSSRTNRTGRFQGTNNRIILENPGRKKSLAVKTEQREKCERMSSDQNRVSMKGYENNL